MQHRVMSFAALMQITHSRLGEYDAPCPLCSHLRKPANRKKPVLKVWHKRPGFATFCCQHCGATGSAHGGDNPIAQSVNLKRLAPPMRDGHKAKIEHVTRRRRIAQHLFDSSIPIQGTPAERYLRVRGITCPLPPTLRFLPTTGAYPPAMIAPFGIPAEPEPGLLDIRNMVVNAVHLTRLKPDGSGKIDMEGQPDKLLLGSALGLPLVLAPINDLAGLGITEGIEDALSLHQSTGLGAWAAGCANRLPALARAVPHYTESITILVDDNKDGRKNSHELARQLRTIRGARFDVRLLDDWLLSRAAA